MRTVSGEVAGRRPKGNKSSPSYNANKGKTVTPPSKGGMRGTVGGNKRDAGKRVP
jgi:hypothetical protein